MTAVSSIATVSLYPNRSAQLRLFALWYFATLMIAWNIAGHTFLGFEQSWAHPVVAVLAACVTQLILEWIDARSIGRKPRYRGSVANFLNFLPPAMITGFACAMLLYPNDRLAPIVFASVLAIASKVLFRIRLENGSLTHFLNPSNFGIVATLLLFSDIGQAPPYQFTENITGFWHWALPAAILATGIVVHGYATGRLPLCIAWLLGFVGQGVFRAWLAGNDWYVPLMPMSSAGFILFTLYMIPDPATTPILKGRQAVFGVGVAVAYAVLQLLHIVFGLFLALILVCCVRGLCITIANARRKAIIKKEPSIGETISIAPLPAVVAKSIDVSEEVEVNA
jgi:enediyne biosynthesis protein E5